MRKIVTSNNQVELIEVSKDGVILSSIGFQMGELYWTIKNNKVVFYLNDSETPYVNDVWTANLPIIIDDVEYATVEDASAALHHIMNDRFQEQLDQLNEDLAAESARAEEAEQQLDDAIDDERARATSAETHLQTEITELSGTVATFDERITRAQEDARQAFELTEAEIARSTAKDAEHDASISGLTNTLNSEIQRALSAETALHNELLAEAQRAEIAESGITASLNNEIQNRIADVDAEEARAIAAESGITASLNAEIARATARENAIDDKADAEITRSTAKDVEHDTLISGLTSDLADEVARATAAEGTLQDNIDAEEARAIAAEGTLQDNIDAEEAARIADVDAEEARATSAETALHNEIVAESERAQDAEDTLDDAIDAEVLRSTNKDTLHDTLISGLTDDLADEIARATAAEGTLHNEIVAESERAEAAEDVLDVRLDNEISRAASEEQRIENKLDTEIARAEGAESGLTTALNDEIARSTAKDIEHDAFISGLTNNLQSEILRAVARENAIDDKVDAEVLRSSQKDLAHDNAISELTDSIAREASLARTNEAANKAKIDKEIEDRIAADDQLVDTVNSETRRALAAESAITLVLSDEITRSTNKDTEHDNRISANTVSINAEIARATNIEGALRSEINAETSARTSADNALIQRVTAVEISKADANNVYTKAESDSKYATKEGVSGDCYTKAQTDELLNQRAEKALAVATAEYVSANKIINFKNISGSVISSIDATPFLIDGMLDSVSIVNNNLVFVWNTDSGKQTVSIPLTDIFNPNNYYNKTQSDALLATKLDATAYTPSDLSNYYKKSETSGKTEISNALALKANESDLEAHVASTSVHTTAAEKQLWNGKQNALTPGNGIDITNNIISCTAVTPSITVDSTLSTTSTNPVQNKVITSALNNKADSSTLNNYMLKSQIWCGTEQEYNAIAVKDPNVIYLVH
jgi:hypothetical protein